MEKKVVIGLALIWVILLMAYIFIPGGKNKTSDEITQIEKDLDNNEINSLDKELGDIEKEL